MGFVSLNSGLSGILAGRAGMDTAAHNVANANTPGYTRQRVVQASRSPLRSPIGSIGSGVSVQEIARTRDAFLDARMRGSQEASGRLSTRSDLMLRAEAVLGEPDQGVTAELSELWAAFEELALRPADGATRRQVLSALESLAARVREIAGGWQQLHGDTVRRMQASVQEVNGLTAQVAELNRDILDASSTAGQPNDLMDRRDALLDELSRRVGATATAQPDGTVRVSIDGLALVSGTRAQPLGVDPVTLSLTHPSGLVPMPGGEIAGLQGFLTRELSGLVGELDAFAEALTDALNAQHTSGYAPDGSSGGPLLTFTGSALTLTVALKDPDGLAAAEGSPPAEHDGGNATALAALRVNAGLDGRYRAIVAEYGADVAAARRAADSQEQLTSAAAAARRGMHGVSLDEEMVSLLNYQRALEAASRVVTSADQALDVLINRTGIVGR